MTRNKQDWQNLLRENLAQMLDASSINACLSHIFETAPTSIRLNPLKCRPFVSQDKVFWHQNGFYLPERPRFDRELNWHLGKYYVQEASSMFLTHVLKTLKPKAELVLDMCAAPGGKCTQLIDAFPDSLIVANEVETKRAAILRDNLVKWGATNVICTSRKAQVFAERSRCLFDVILVDAPCSGEGMLRKSYAAQTQYCTGLIEQCRKMQQEILDGAEAALKPGGVLIYCTCTWNITENESHFINRPQLKPVSIAIEPSWEVHVRDATYRFFPHRIRGEGLSISVFRKSEEMGKSTPKEQQAPFQKSRALEWVDSSHSVVTDTRGVHFALPRHHLDHFMKLASSSGAQPLLRLGKFDRRDQLVPDIALAQQIKLPLPYRRIDCDKAQAEKYIARESFPSFGFQGEWLLACYQDLPLGFLKDVGSRCNNYYPTGRAVR